MIAFPIHCQEELGSTKRLDRFPLAVLAIFFTKAIGQLNARNGPEMAQKWLSLYPILPP
jgi:hypothetical protein